MIPNSEQASRQLVSCLIPQDVLVLVDQLKEAYRDFSNGDTLRRLVEDDAQRLELIPIRSKPFMRDNPEGWESL